MKNTVRRLIEATTLIIVAVLIVSTDIAIPFMVKPIIITTVVVFILYLECICSRLWIRVVLPYSFMGTVLLISRMVYGAVLEPHYIYVVTAYAVTAFTLYHILYRLISILVGDRKIPFKEFLKGLHIDMLLYLIAITILSTWVYILRSIQLWAYILLVLGVWIAWITTYMYLSKKLFRILLRTHISSKGFAHPIEPEADKVLNSILTIALMIVLAIPLMFTYTNPVLQERGFVPLALLGVIEAINCLLYTIVYVYTRHGAYIEQLVSNNRKPVYVPIEEYRVFRTWRDISWFLNRSIGYYYRLKYLSALYMMFQGIEILSKRLSNKTIYYGNLHELLQEGYKYILEKNLGSYVELDLLRKTIDVFKPSNTVIIEVDTKDLDKEPEEIKELYKRAFSSIINTYVKMIDVPSEARKIWRTSIESTISRLENLVYNKINDPEEITMILDKIKSLKNLLNKDYIAKEDLEKYFVKQPLTVNMLRNYLVHGQLVRNAILYKGSRDAFDKIMAQPSILYSLYTLLLAYLINSYRNILIR